MKWIIDTPFFFLKEKRIQYVEPLQSLFPLGRPAHTLRVAKSEDFPNGDTDVKKETKQSPSTFLKKKILDEFVL